MIRLWKGLAIALLAALTLAPAASASIFHHHHNVVIYYQTASSPAWYEVQTVQTGPPVYTYTAPAPASAPIYVYNAPTPPPPAMGDVKIVAPAQNTTIWIDGQFAGTTGNVMQVALNAGDHEMQLRDPSGNTVFSGTVDVVAGQTTQIQPSASSGY